MSKHRKPYFQKLQILFILSLFWLSYPVITEANPKKMQLRMQTKTIVLDPGHGGYDNGARGLDGTLEKTVTLNFVRILAEELKKTYNVVLTRTDDYWVDALTRTATANHLNADLFISIHTGGSFLHQAGGISLYYYNKASNPDLGLATESSKGFKSIDPQVWSCIQNRHQKASKILAELILKDLDEPKKFQTEIQGAPLMVLEGADMPAVLIEIGYISNPVDEKSLGNIEVLTRIAAGIRNGIDDFFEKFQQYD